MAPVPSQVFVSSKVTPSEASLASMDFKALPLNRIPLIGAFFLVLVIILVAGIIAYMLYKSCRPAKSSKNSIRPLLLPKLIPIEEAIAISAKTLSITDYQPIIGYKTNGNGVKKSIRITPPISVLPGTAPSELSAINKQTVSIPNIPVSRPSNSSMLTNTQKSSPINSQPSHCHKPPTSPCAAHTRSLITRKVADMKANPKLFPVQGPLRPMDSGHSWSPSKSISPINKGILAATEPVLAKGACISDQLAISAPSSPLGKITVTWNVEIMNRNPKLFPVQGPIKPLDVRSTDIRLPANALTASTVAHVEYARSRLDQRFNTFVSGPNVSKNTTTGSRAISIRNMPYIKSVLPVHTVADNGFYENKFHYMNNQASLETSRHAADNIVVLPKTNTGLASRPDFTNLSIYPPSSRSTLCSLASSSSKSNIRSGIRPSSLRDSLDTVADCISEAKANSRALKKKKSVKGKENVPIISVITSC